MYTFTLDAVTHKTPTALHTGDSLKLFGPSSIRNYQLYRESPGDLPDAGILDAEMVRLLEGEVLHFYTCPPATFG